MNELVKCGKRTDQTRQQEHSLHLSLADCPSSREPTTIRLGQESTLGVTEDRCVCLSERAGPSLHPPSTKEVLAASEQWVLSPLGQDVRPVMSERDCRLAHDLAQGWNSEHPFLCPHLLSRCVLGAMQGQQELNCSHDRAWQRLCPTAG